MAGLLTYFNNRSAFPLYYWITKVALAQAIIKFTAAGTVADFHGIPS